MGEAKARAKDDLTRVRESLEVTGLTVERTSLLLELRASKDKVSALHSQVGKEKEAMVEVYQKPLEHIFTYGYGCCVFKHGIHGDRLRIPDGMPDSTVPLPPKIFENLGGPLAPSTD